MHAEKTLRNMLAVAAILALNMAPIHRALSATGDPWKALNFLQGTWEARAQAGSAAAQVSGSYTFAPELKQHVLARHSVYGGCNAPEAFNCDHNDIFYVYQEAENQPLKAIYFDNEGHVIHYVVLTPDPTTAVFISDPTASGPQFRLVYELHDALMSGKFQMRMPGQAEWKSYLEWSGARK
jgi:hypothetical protein